MQRQEYQLCLRVWLLKFIRHEAADTSSVINRDAGFCLVDKTLSKQGGNENGKAESRLRLSEQKARALWMEGSSWQLSSMSQFI